MINQNQQPKTFLGTYHEVLSKVGTFASYQCMNSQGRVVEGQNIELRLKPGQQLKVALSQALNDPQGFTVINDFMGGSGQLNIPNQKIKNAYESVRIYLNPNIIGKGEYENILAGNIAVSLNYSNKENNRLTNNSVGVCHTQDVYLMVEQNCYNGKSYNQPRAGAIDLNERPLKLFSAPALDFTKAAKNLGDPSMRDTKDKSPEELILGMYENLFRAAVTEECHFIAMPPGGLGAFLGNTKSQDPAEKVKIATRVKMHFNALMQAAKKFPQLNIVYNPGVYAAIFRTFDSPGNVYPAYGQNVVFIADELNKKRLKGGLWNPSDVKAVYEGDIGVFWEDGTGERFVTEEDLIANICSGVLGRRDLNPEAWKEQNIIELAPVNSSSTLNPNQPLQQNPADIVCNAIHQIFGEVVKGVVPDTGGFAVQFDGQYDLLEAVQKLNSIQLPNSSRLGAKIEDPADTPYILIPGNNSVVTNVMYVMRALAPQKPATQQNPQLDPANNMAEKIKVGLEKLYGRGAVQEQGVRYVQPQQPNQQQGYYEVKFTNADVISLVNNELGSFTFANSNEKVVLDTQLNTIFIAGRIQPGEMENITQKIFETRKQQQLRMSQDLQSFFGTTVGEASVIFTPSGVGFEVQIKDLTTVFNALNSVVNSQTIILEGNDTSLKIISKNGQLPLEQLVVAIKNACEQLKRQRQSQQNSNSQQPQMPMDQQQSSNFQASPNLPQQPEGKIVVKNIMQAPDVFGSTVRGVEYIGASNGNQGYLVFFTTENNARVAAEKLGAGVTVDTSNKCAVRILKPVSGTTIDDIKCRVAQLKLNETESKLADIYPSAGVKITSKGQGHIITFTGTNGTWLATAMVSQLGQITCNNHQIQFQQQNNSITIPSQTSGATLDGIITRLQLMAIEAAMQSSFHQSTPPKVEFARHPDTGYYIIFANQPAASNAANELRPRMPNGGRLIYNANGKYSNSIHISALWGQTSVQDVKSILQQMQNERQRKLQAQQKLDKVKAAMTSILSDWGGIGNIQASFAKDNNGYYIQFDSLGTAEAVTKHLHKIKLAFGGQILVNYNSSYSNSIHIPQQVGLKTAEDFENLSNYVKNKRKVQNYLQDDKWQSKVHGPARFFRSAPTGIGEMRNIKDENFGIDSLKKTVGKRPGSRWFLRDEEYTQTFYTAIKTGFNNEYEAMEKLANFTSNNPLKVK